MATSRTPSVSLAVALLVILGCSSEESAPKSPEGPVLSPRASVQSCFADAAASGQPMATDSTPGAAPEWLSETGCFDDLAAGVPGPDLIPFAVASELWTDGAKKQRYMVLPPGEKVTVAKDGAWDFPLGSVLLKHFGYDSAGPPTVETRVMVRRSAGWEVHSFEWLQDGSDARLLNEWKEIPVETPAGQVTHLFPSRSSCDACHSPGAEFVLGPTTPQMNRQVRWDGGSGNQVEAMLDIGAIELAQPEPTSNLDRMPAPTDPDESLETRARAYLHANCGHCHRPGGWVPPELNMDLRWQSSFADTRTCGVSLQYGTLFGKKRIEPGQPDASGLVERVESQGLNRMPPMGTGLVDTKGVDVLRSFIASLSSCPPPPKP